MTNKSYVKIMLNQEQAFIKADDKFFAGYVNGRFSFTENEEEAQQIKTKEDLISICVLLNFQLGKEAQLYHLVEDKMEPLEIYNNFILAELQISSEKWGKEFNLEFKEFCDTAKFKVSFVVEGKKLWVRETLNPDFIVDSIEKLNIVTTENEEEAGSFLLKEFAEQKSVSPKEVSDKLLDIIETGELKPVGEYKDYLTEAFGFIFNRELKKQIQEERQERMGGNE